LEPVTAPPPLTSFSASERQRAQDRYAILKTYLEQDVSVALVAKNADIPVQTLRDWLRRYQKYGLAGLARKERHDKGNHRISAKLKKVIEGLALRTPPLSAASIHRQINVTATTIGEPCPSYMTVLRVVKGLEPGLITLAHEGTKAYGENFDLLYRREADAPNAVWQADHTQLDIFVDDGGQGRKPWLTVILDDYSRAVAGYAVSFSAPSAHQTALALRQAIWRKGRPDWSVCGIPGILYTDHGSDFTSRHIEQVAADLKFQLVFSTVGQPRGRGKIERFFKSVSQVLLPRLPGFAPSGKAAATLTLAELSEEIENYFTKEYNLTPHSATGQTPQERWNAGGFLPHMPESLEKLDLLLLTVPKTRRVQRDGIRLSGFRYIDLTLSAYVGEQVVIRYDPRDMAEIRVFHKDRFICRAVCQELAGETVPLREIVSARRRQRRELRQTIEDRTRTVDSLLEARRSRARIETETVPDAPRPGHNLKRYETD
jgi:putative transposase